MENQDNHPKPEDYIRMFAGQSFVYLLTDIFLGFYNALGVLSVQDKNSWMSFLPKSSHEKTLPEGKHLYTTKDLFDEYQKKFHDYINLSEKYFESILSKEKLTGEDVRSFLNLASEHFSNYSKTEFFYTDNLDPKEMVISVEDFDQMKLKGRSYLNRILFEDSGYIRRLIEKIEAQTGVHENELLSYGIEELVDLVDHGDSLDSNIVNHRDTFFVSKDLKIIGPSSKDLVDKFLSQHKESSDEIKGTIAYKGKVVGRARVLVPDFSDFGKIQEAVDQMQEGEILVAETTSPEIIRACKKAAAIVTNQGGTLSHAAIISRELKIPCIVGTNKNVTTNIKTGDMIEVDANNGIVRII